MRKVLIVLLMLFIGMFITDSTPRAQTTCNASQELYGGDWYIEGWYLWTEYETCDGKRRRCGAHIFSFGFSAGTCEPV